MKIVLLGGAFDPPHRGHRIIAKSVIGAGLAEEVWFVPVRHHHFIKQMTEAQHRAAMLELICQEDQQTQGWLGAKKDSSSNPLRVEYYELNRPAEEINYSFETLEALSQQHPEHAFAWLIGSDNVESFSRWKDYQKMLKQYPVYVYPRQGWPMTSLLTGMIALTQVEPVTISSTEIRDKVAQGLPITDLVDPAIERYIYDHELYRSEQ